MSDRPRSPRTRTRKARSATAKPRGKLRRLLERPGAIIGDPAKLADTPTFDEAAWLGKWSTLLPNKGSR